ncbi:MAG: oligopeptidase A, partial [Burkholderiaceae bacterium]|nr:oligopeptidase A [Burkholderiaceae bacterium]
MLNIEQNPLLDFSGLPRFSDIKPEHVAPAIDFLLHEARAVIEELENQTLPVSWNNFVEPLEDTTEKLARAWGIVGHLNAVVDTPELRAAYNDNQGKLTEFWTALGQNLALYQQYKRLHASSEFDQMSAARQKIIHNALRDFKLGGAELDAEKKARYAEIQDEIS